MKLIVLVLSLILTVPFLASANTVIESDICVYGGTSGGIIAAVQAVRMGKTVSLAVFDTHLGGLTAGGLGATDVGTSASIAGASREFYRRIGAYYQLKERFYFEPHVAKKVYEDWLDEVKITPRWNQRLASVKKTEGRLTEIQMEDGTIYRAKIFIDASYEGDLMAMAGASFTFGREGTNTYNESYTGIRANTPKNQFTVNVDPYVKRGDPTSGLLPFVQPGDGGVPGDGDKRIQAYNYRLCFTKNETNRLPILPPLDYDTNRYELLGRLLDAYTAAGVTPNVISFLGYINMPNGKTDMNNNGGLSTDDVGMNWTYATNSYTERERIRQEHLRYTQGLVYYLATNPRSPTALRNEMLTWGPCRDEWTNNGGYSPQIYVREARRMISDYVMTQADCQSLRTPSDSICLGSYNMDSHNCQRIVKNGYAINEGDVQIPVPHPYPISYRSIVPKKSECKNLFVTFAVSASHVAFCSVRMEPVFMMMSQSAATAAAFAIDDNVDVQNVNYTKLSQQLIADGQLLTWGDSIQDTNGIIIDNTDKHASQIGSWTESTANVGIYYGKNYIHDGNTGKGSKSVCFTPDLPSAGLYKVQLCWPAYSNRATNVPVVIYHSSGSITEIVNQTKKNGVWVTLLTTNFDKGTNNSLIIKNNTTTGYVIADAVRWLPATTDTPPVVQIIATDPICSKTGKLAKVTILRSQTQTEFPITVSYKIIGTASNGTDIVNLPGVITLPAGVTMTNICIRAINDFVPKGNKQLILTLQPGTNYVIGSLSNCIVQVLDTPLQAWRFTHFTATELTNSTISGPDADPDGDGASNIQEFLSGTDPRNPASALRVNIDVKANIAHIQLLAISNHTYSLEYQNKLTSGPWQELSRFESAPTNQTIQFTDKLPADATNRFYRVSTLWTSQ